MTDHAAPETPELIRAVALSKVYSDGNVAALKDINLTIRQGEFAAIMGKSGSGKSTLLQIIGLLDTPTSGDLYFQQQRASEIRHTDQVRSAKIGFVFQSFHLLPMLTALENVQVPMFESTLSPRQRREKAATLLERAGIGYRAGHLPRSMSVGERQRVAIARALANDPLLLLADEPTGSLDSKTGEDVLDLFEQLHAQSRMTIVMVTHDHQVANRAKRLIRISDGRVEADSGTAG